MALWLTVLAMPAVAAPELPLGRAVFEDPFSPPAYRKLHVREQAHVELGQAVFNTQWLPAGTPDAGRRAGLGPLFNSGSCDSCHNSAKRGRGPVRDGPVPVGLVIQLGTRSPDGKALPEGDPTYGLTLNTSALDGVAVEGNVTVHFAQQQGRYPDGTSWTLRRPVYEIHDLHYGPLKSTTLIKPRLAPALFGLGLLEAAMSDIKGPDAAHFGWQGDVPSLRTQTAKAFALEMGLTSSVRPQDDRTAAQHPEEAGPPEVAEELLDALVAFEETMAVPVREAPPIPEKEEQEGAELFTRTGCAACHPPALPSPAGPLDAYTDLKLHDMGSALADSTLQGLKVTSRWRTPPLWALDYRGNGRPDVHLLHDGRARSVEEAILWHDGEGRIARDNFQKLSRKQRHQLIQWVEAR